MAEHDELMRRAVEGLRASRSPTAEAKARVEAALQLQLGGPPGGFDPGGASTGGGSSGGSVMASAAKPVTIGWAAKVVGATVGLTTGGLLAVQVGIGALSEPTSQRQPVRDEVVAVAATEPEEVLEEQSQPPEEELGAITVTGRVLPKPRVQEPTQDDVEPADALAAELALIQAAKRARTPSAALELLEQHALDFPNGTMESEREALAVVALCQLDRPEDARTRARSLVAQRPGLPLLERMRSECPVLTDLLRQTVP